MGCCASSEAGVDAPARESKGLQRGVLREASTRDLGNNCSEGHPLQKYDLLDTLGTGGFAVVKRVRDKFTSENFAMTTAARCALGRIRAIRPPTRCRISASFSPPFPREPCLATRTPAVRHPSRYIPARMFPQHIAHSFCIPSPHARLHRSAARSRRRRFRRRQGAHDREGGHVRDRDPSQPQARGDP